MDHHHHQGFSSPKNNIISSNVHSGLLSPLIRGGHQSPLSTISNKTLKTIKILDSKLDTKIDSKFDNKIDSKQDGKLDSKSDSYYKTGSEVDKQIDLLKFSNKSNFDEIFKEILSNNIQGTTKVLASPTDSLEPTIKAIDVYLAECFQALETSIKSIDLAVNKYYHQVQSSGSQSPIESKLAELSVKQNQAFNDSLTATSSMIKNQITKYIADVLEQRFSNDRYYLQSKVSSMQKQIDSVREASHLFRISYDMNNRNRLTESNRLLAMEYDEKLKKEKSPLIDQINALQDEITQLNIQINSHNQEKEDLQKEIVTCHVEIRDLSRKLILLSPRKLKHGRRPKSTSPHSPMNNFFSPISSPFFSQHTDDYTGNKTKIITLNKHISEGIYMPSPKVNRSKSPLSLVHPETHFFTDSPNHRRLSPKQSNQSSDQQSIELMNQTTNQFITQPCSNCIENEAMNHTLRIELDKAIKMIDELNKDNKNLHSTVDDILMNFSLQPIHPTDKLSKELSTYISNLSNSKSHENLAHLNSEMINSNNENSKLESQLDDKLPNNSNKVEGKVESNLDTKIESEEHNNEVKKIDNLLDNNESNEDIQFINQDTNTNSTVDNKSDSDDEDLDYEIIEDYLNNAIDTNTKPDDNKLNGNISNDDNEVTTTNELIDKELDNIRNNSNDINNNSLTIQIDSPINSNIENKEIKKLDSSKSNKRDSKKEIKRHSNSKLDSKADNKLESKLDTYRDSKIKKLEIQIDMDSKHDYKMSTRLSNERKLLAKNITIQPTSPQSTLSLTAVLSLAQKKANKKFNRRIIGNIDKQIEIEKRKFLESSADSNVDYKLYNDVDGKTDGNVDSKIDKELDDNDRFAFQIDILLNSAEKIVRDANTMNDQYMQSYVWELYKVVLKSVEFQRDIHTKLLKTNYQIYKLTNHIKELDSYIDKHKQLTSLQLSERGILLVILSNEVNKLRNQIIDQRHNDNANKQNFKSLSYVKFDAVDNKNEITNYLTTSKSKLNLSNKPSDKSNLPDIRTKVVDSKLDSKMESKVDSKMDSKIDSKKDNKVDNKVDNILKNNRPLTRSATSPKISNRQLEKASENMLENQETKLDTDNKLDNSLDNQLADKTLTPKPLTAKQIVNRQIGNKPLSLDGLQLVDYLTDVLNKQNISEEAPIDDKMKELQSIRKDIVSLLAEQIIRPTIRIQPMLAHRKALHTKLSGREIILKPIDKKS